MAKTPELLPCPFCGSTEVGVSEGLFNRRIKSVGCGECGADGPAYPKQADAIRAWNQRKAPA